MDEAFFAACVGAIAWPPLMLALWRGGALRKAALALVTFGWALGVYSVFIEPQQLHVRRVALESAAWTGPPLRIGLISDTHAGNPMANRTRMLRVVGRMNTERPDIVLLLGDYVGGHTEAQDRSAHERASVMAGLAPLGGFTAPLGAFAVLGNHDWWYDGPAVERALLNMGVTVVDNSAVQVSRQAGSFWIAGLSDYDSDRGDPDWAPAMADVPESAPVLAIAHWPDVFAQAPSRVAATFAGHSHCGQVNFPLIGRPILPSPGSKRWPCGLYEEGGRLLYVTGGVGASGLPVRFGAPPEIVIVTLTGSGR